MQERIDAAIEGILALQGIGQEGSAQRHGAGPWRGARTAADRFLPPRSQRRFILACHPGAGIGRLKGRGERERGGGQRLELTT